MFSKNDMVCSMALESEPSIHISSHWRRLENFVILAGVASIAHPGGNLAAHLNRVAAILERWNVEQTIVDAGHLHAAYGTDGFGVSIVGSAGREELFDLVGKEAEALISLYCRCDRSASYRSWTSNHPVVIDRDTRQSIPINDAQRKALISITVANEIDVLSHDNDLMRRHGSNLARLFGGWRPWLTERALADLDEWISTCRV